LNNLNIWLVSLAVAAATYLLTGLAVVISRSLYERTRAVVDRLGRILNDEAGSGLDPSHREDQANRYLSSLAVRRIKRVITDTVLPAKSNVVICAHLLNRLGVKRVQRDAMARTNSRNPWPRITALQILAFGRTEAAWAALEKALISPEPRLVGAAVTILGNLRQTHAAELLAKAMRVGCFPSSRISTFLDRFPLDLSPLVGSFLSQPSPNIRYWGAIMLRRYPGLKGGSAMLASLTQDQNPQVRRAAIESLSLLGGEMAPAEARRLLTDEVSFVRAYAARALGTLHVHEAAPAVASLLADRDWWVRYAAKVSLEAMGSQAIPHILPLLKHQDRFARNGAAEVLQNLEYFEQLLAEELLGPSQPQRHAILEQMAQAGGVRMSEAMINRLPPAVHKNASLLLSAFGLERNGGKQ
jgi:HEAT repeat protein